MRGMPVYLLILPCLLFLSGCARVHAPAPGPGYLPYPTRAKGLDALKQISRDISHLGADARLRLTVDGKKRPGVRCRIYYLLKDEHEFIRASGFGPFGLILFDCLVTDKEIFLYLPSRQTVYTAGTDDMLGDHLKMEEIIRMASLVLNPWLVAFIGQTTQVSCKDATAPVRSFIAHGVCDSTRNGCICLDFCSLYGVGHAVFGKGNLGPILLDTPGFDVVYHNDLTNRERGVPYPLGASIGFKEMALAIEIRFTRINLDKSVMEDELFDKRIFSSMPTRPLETLL